MTLRHSQVNYVKLELSQLSLLVSAWYVASRAAACEEDNEQKQSKENVTWPVCFTFYVILLLEIVNKNCLKLLISHMPTNVLSDQVTALNYITRSFQISIHH